MPYPEDLDDLDDLEVAPRRDFPPPLPGEAYMIMFPDRPRRHPPPYDECRGLARDIAREIVRGAGASAKNLRTTRRRRKAHQRDLRRQLAVRLRPRGKTSTMILLVLAQLLYHPVTPVYVFVHPRDVREICRDFDRAVCGLLREMAWYRTPRARGICCAVRPPSRRKSRGQRASLVARSPSRRSFLRSWSFQTMNKTERESLAIAIARVTARRPLPWRFLGDTPHSVFAARGESVAELDAEAPVEKLLVDCVNAVPKLLEALAAAEARIASLEPLPAIKPWIAASEDSEFARQLTATVPLAPRRAGSRDPTAMLVPRRAGPAMPSR